MPFLLRAQVDMGQAMGYLRSGEYPKAIPIFLDILKADLANQEAIQGIAEAYSANGNHAESAIWMRKLISNDPSNTELRYNLAKSCLRFRNYQEARKIFRELYSLQPQEKSWQQWIRMCDSLSVSSSMHSGKPDIAILSLNSSSNEGGSAVWQGGKLIYATKGPGGPALYQSDMEDSGIERAFYAPKLLAQPQPGMFECHPALQKENGSIWFTRIPWKADSLPGLAEGKGAGIFSGIPQQGEWKNLFSFPFNSPAYDIRHPAPSPDGKWVIFASDMPGGLGGYDLYVSRFESGWQKPENLGPEINTSGNELTPRLNEDGTTLFFASDGHPGMGKLDLFLAAESEGHWTNRTALPYPLNSKFNDFGISPEPGGRSGFFMSDRPGGYGKDDIFIYEFRNQRDSCPYQQAGTVCVTLEETGFSASESGAVSFEWTTGDGYELKGNGVRHCFLRPGYFDVMLTVTETVAGMPVQTQIPKRIPVGPENSAWIECKDRDMIGNEMSFDGGLSNLKSSEVLSWVWDFGDGTTAIGSRVSHIYTRPGLYEVRLEIMGVKSDLSRIVKTCSLKKISISGR